MAGAAGTKAGRLAAEAAAPFPDRAAPEWGEARPVVRRDRGTFAGRGPRGYRRSDDRITEEICEALTWDPDIDPTDIEVRVQNGEVTLSGAADAKYAKRLAEDIAEECFGVAAVRNELRVGRGASA